MSLENWGKPCSSLSGGETKLCCVNCQQGLQKIATLERGLHQNGQHQTTMPLQLEAGKDLK
jgi:hypothetical protein